MGDPTAFTYVTPEQMFEADPQRTLQEYQELAKNDGICEVCDGPVWKLADTGLCFPCTTGETDASEDYELI